MAVAAATSQVNARIDSALKASGDAGLAAAGYTTTQAIRALWAFAARWAGVPEVISRVLGLAPKDADEPGYASGPGRADGAGSSEWAVYSEASEPGIDDAAAAVFQQSDAKTAQQGVAITPARAEATAVRRMSSREIDEALLAAIGGVVSSCYAGREAMPEASPKASVRAPSKEERSVALDRAAHIVDDFYQEYGLTPPSPGSWSMSDEGMKELAYKERGLL